MYPLKFNVHRQESSLLRQELSQRHSEDSKAALSELANLKDSAMKQAKQLWEEEQITLLKQVLAWYLRTCQMYCDHLHCYGPFYAD